MVERGSELGLADEPLPEPIVIGDLGREHLERDLALQSHVLGQIDGAHAAATEQALDPVPPEFAPDGGRSVHVNLVLPDAHANRTHPGG